MKKRFKMSCIVCVVLLLLSGCRGEGKRIEQSEGRMWNVDWEKEIKVIHKDATEALNSICVNNGNIVYSTISSGEEKFYYTQNKKTTSKKLLCTNNMATTDVLDYCLDKDGNSFFIVLEATDEGENIKLRKYNPDGEVETIKWLNDFHKGNFDDCYGWKVSVKEDGNILVYSQLAYLLLDEVGNKIKEGSWENNVIYDVAYIGNDILFLHQYKNDLNSFLEVKLDTEDSKEIINIPASVRFDFVEYSDSDILMYTDSECYCYNIQTEQLEMLFKWSDYGIVGDNICCIYVQDGNVHCIIYENSVLCDVTYVETELAEAKTELVLGCIGESTQLRKAVADFNNSSSSCTITIIDYAEKDEETAVNNMYNAILADEGPDIIGFEPRYANDIVLGESGMLEDLNGYLNESQVVNAEELVGSIYQALLADNKLYMLPTNFTIDTLITKEKWVGKDGRWTGQDLLNIMKNNPKIEAAVSKETMIECGILYGMGNVPDIVGDYLEIANLLPLDIVYDTNEASRRRGDILFEQCMIDSVSTYLYKKSVWGEDSTFVGFPNVEGNGMAIIPVNCFGINAKSEHKEEAWKFIESFFTDEWQQNITPNWCFSICEDVLKKQFEDAAKSEYYYDGNNNRLEVPLMSYILDGATIDVYAANEQDIETLKSMLENIRVVRRENTSMVNIVQEEAAYYFAGEKEVEQVTNVIRNRIDLLLNE